MPWRCVRAMIKRWLSDAPRRRSLVPFLYSTQLPGFTRLRWELGTGVLVGSVFNAVVALMAHLFWPDKKRLRAKGYASVCHVPVLFESDWKYHCEANRYLRERALAEWTPLMMGPRVVSKKYLTEKSLRTVANALINFLEWCERRGKYWAQLSYTQDILSGYQAQMLTGGWSVRGCALKGSTVNQRVSHACNFLLWAADRGLRKPFEIVASETYVRTESATVAHGHRALDVQSRAGSVRQAPSSLRIPTDAEVAKWLTSVRVERGETKALMCELVLATALRREEVVQWRVDTLPLERADWVVMGDYVEVVIKYGAKGAKYAGADGEEGPPRKIAVPLSVAHRVHEYREFRRPKARAQFVRNASSPEERRSRQRQRVRQLFLSDATGEPISAQVIYEAWTAASALPYKGWSPHTGRDYWSCKKLLEAMERRTRALALSLSKVPYGWICDASSDTINLVIRPQLGHVSVQTTQRYIVWVERAFTLAALHCEYEQGLEALLQATYKGDD